MGETWGMIHPEAKFLSNYEPVESDKLSACFVINMWSILENVLWTFEKNVYAAAVGGTFYIHLWGLFGL